MYANLWEMTVTLTTGVVVGTILMCLVFLASAGMAALLERLAKSH